jgi:hypothetical protein
MKAMNCGIVLGFALLVSGCDGAKEPMAKARAAEAEGKLAEAKTLYADVCKANEKSPFCPVAKQHIEALTAREAITALAEGNYAKAKELGGTATTGPAKRVLETLGKTKAMTAFAAFEEAIAGADKAAVRTKMEELANVSSPVADKAKEWLAKNAPALLLAEVKAACKADGTGSCSDLGQKLNKSYPSSPEAAEAQTLMDTEFKRVFSFLQQAEGLLVQRLEIYNWQTKKDLCLMMANPLEMEAETPACIEAAGIPSDRGDALNTDFLEKAWKKKLDEVHDPGMIKSLQDRWDQVGALGIYDPAPLPKLRDKPAANK